MNINWLVRFKNKLFWMALIPALFTLAGSILALLGVSIDLSGWQALVLAVVEAIFGVLLVLGVVVDPTTQGIGDSERAMNYTEPHKDQ